MFEIDDDDVADVQALVDGPVNDGSNITDDDEDISHTGVFRSTVNVDERSRLQQLLNLRPATQFSRHVATPVIDYPEVSEEPLNEYTTDGYIVRAFPCLFPYGCADLRDESRRKVPIKEGEYFTHLMRYYDGRFGRDPRFVHFALNAKLRWALNRAAGVFVTKKQMATLTVADIKERPEYTNNNLGRSIARWSSNVSGLSPYWYREKRELIAICKVHCPHAFVTFSAADTHWNELHRLIEQQRAAGTGTQPLNIQSLSEAGRKTRKIKNLIEYPHIAAEYLHKRFIAFLNRVLKKDLRLKLAHHWFRYEWQFRGSGHIHGFLWFVGAPDISTLDIDVIEDRERIRVYFGEEIVRGRVTLANQPPAVVNPVSHALPFDMSDAGIEKDLTELVNRVQQHSCSCYCLRPKKKSPRQYGILREDLAPQGEPEMECRFGFALPIRHERSIEKDVSTGRYMFYLQRDEEATRINQFSPHMLQTWRANTDFKPVTSLHGVLTYLAKYASKAEKASPSLVDLLTSIASKLDDDTSALTLLRKMLATYPIERDISSQEACHQLLGLPMVITDFKTVYANLYTNVRVSLVVDLFTDNLEDSNAIAHAQSTLERYVNRQPELNDISLYDILEKYTWKPPPQDSIADTIGTWHLLTSRSKTRVVVAIPDPPGDYQRQDVCRTAVLLHIPFRSLEEFDQPIEDSDGLLETDSDGNFTVNWQRILREHWGDIPEWKRRLLYNTRDADGPIEGSEEEEEDDDDSEYGVDLGQGRRMADEGWEGLAGMGPRAQFDEADISNVTDMGRRPQDLAHDWQQDLIPYGGLQHLLSLDGTRWIQQQRAEAVDVNDDVLVYINPITLNPGQKAVFDIIHNHHLDLSPNKQPLLMIVAGTAGTGKSYLIQTIRYAMCYDQNGARLRLPAQYCPVAAFTGVAAFNVDGVTIHSLFRLLLGNADDRALSPDQVQSLQDKLKDVQYLILDEISMLGSTMLTKIHERLAVAFPAATDRGLPFGGRSLIMIGDFAQLPPVSDIPMYALPQRTGKVGVVRGFNLYRQFTLFVRLSANMRQQGHDQDVFRSILSRARDGEWTEDDRRVLFNHRNIQLLSPAEQRSFDNASRLLPTNEGVRDYNRSALERLGHPIAIIKAVNTSAGNINHTDVGLARVDSDIACNLTQNLNLSVGARVMVKKNLWTTKGLVNGALGYIRGIVWSTYDRDKLPDFVLVEMDNYSGPAFLQDFPRIIPIPPYKGSFEHKGTACTRTQLPLVLSWAITIHKSQGMTLDKAVVDIGRKEMSNGITFVAVSRVRRMADIAFSATYTLQRLSTIKNGSRIGARLKEEKRLDTMSIVPLAADS